MVELQFEPGALDLSQVPIGCDVYRTDDPALRKRLEQSYAQDKPARRVALTARVSGEVGGTLTLTLSDDENHTATAIVARPARTRDEATDDADEIREQLARLGDTPFELGERRARSSRQT